MSFFFCNFAAACVKTRVTHGTAVRLRYVLCYALPTANSLRLRFVSGGAEGKTMYNVQRK